MAKLFRALVKNTKNKAIVLEIWMFWFSFLIKNIRFFEEQPVFEISYGTRVDHHCSIL